MPPAPADHRAQGGRCSKGSTKDSLGAWQVTCLSSWEAQGGTGIKQPGCCLARHRPEAGVPGLSNGQHGATSSAVSECAVAGS
ncbi:hypothetical protein HaLaN_10069 [Haematococcus lacustris]|uniref:Uncharacterized protein n=1 Tax=Haematococcus lacustris TaxID=44745 RepID=A0A699Z475_HAELA|nr:hypothetical protein HaLaN_10069 [Haematococcus lacustris]